MDDLKIRSDLDPSGVITVRQADEVLLIEQDTPDDECGLITEIVAVHTDQAKALADALTLWVASEK